MKASNLTISIPVDDHKCNKNCPYCISKMTGFLEPNPTLVQRNLEKVYTWALATGVTTCLITSKSEPFLNYEMVLQMAEKFRQFTVEIQTNGIWLVQNRHEVETLYKHGVNYIAFSIDTLTQLDRLKPVFLEIQAHNMRVRVCINLTNRISTNFKFIDIFNRIKDFPVSQLLVRNVSIPSNVTEGPEVEWIRENTDYDRYLEYAHEFLRLAIKQNKKPIRRMPFGMDIYAHEGISVAFSDYCIQETHQEDDVRSLIYMENGHLCTSWAEPEATELF